MKRFSLLLVLGCGGDTTTDSDMDLDGPDVMDEVSDASTADSSTGSDSGSNTASALCAPLPPPTGSIVELSPSDDLAATIASVADGTTLSLADGTYFVAPTIIDRSITLRSRSNDPSGVTIDGQYLEGDLFTVHASNVTIAHVTLTHAGGDFIAYTPLDQDLSNLVIHDVDFVDGIGLAVEATPNDGYWADSGSLTCSSVTLSDGGRIEVEQADGCATGGIEGQSTHGWVVSDNRFDGLWCASGGLASPAVRFWRGARDSRIERNNIGNCAQGITLGETQSIVDVRTWEGLDCPDGVVQHEGGVAINNMIWANDSLLFSSALQIGTPLRLDSSCNAQILHNSIYSLQPPPGDGLSVVQNFATSTGIMHNNLASHGIGRDDFADIDVQGNVGSADALSWANPSASGDDFHLSVNATAAIDQGVTTSGIVVDIDIDGDVRDDMPDVGADEFR